MMEQVATVNAVYEYRTPFVTKISNTFPGAHFAVMDVHALVSYPYLVSRITPTTSRLTDRFYR